MILKNKIYILLSLIIITSCTQKKAAPITLKGHVKYHKGYDNNQRNTSFGRNKNASNQNIAVIQPGDNLYNIAQEHNSSVRDLIDANDLEPPYILQIGSKLILPNTKYHKVEEGDNLYKISRLYGMNMNNLIDINNLEEPYNIIIGSKLKVSNSSFKKSNNRRVEAENLSVPSSKKRPVKSAQVKLPYKNNKFIWPVKGKVISSFGQKPGGLYNDGINIKANESDPVKSVEDGLVAYVGNELRGYGNLIIVKHSGGWISAYAHLKKTKVKIGDKVKQGDEIALVGSTGNVDFAQLYFGIRKGREAVNPKSYLQ